MTLTAIAPERIENQTDTPAEPLRMSYDEWLAWADETTQSEWVNGEVIVFMPPKNIHQALIGFLYYVLKTFVDLSTLGRVFVAPFEVRLPQGNAREPDLIFLRSANLHKLTPQRIVGAPDLLVEVISDESVHRDRVDKFDEYEAAGVAEYWLIDNRPGRNRAYFYQLDAQGRYQPSPVAEDGIFRSAVLPGFWLNVDWLWGEEPSALRAIAALLGPEQMADALRRAAE